MDWTIVVSVLVALLFWVLSLVLIGALIAAVTLATVFTVLRGRAERMATGMMETCKQHFEEMMARSDRETAAPLTGDGHGFNPLRDPDPCQEAATGRAVRRGVPHV